MSIHEFLHVMGLPVSDPADASTEDPLRRLEEKAARLDEKLGRLYRALLRRRLRIERLRLAIKHELLSREGTLAKIEKHEVAYRRLLALYGQCKQRLARAQIKIRTTMRAQY